MSRRPSPPHLLICALPLTLALAGCPPERRIVDPGATHREEIAEFISQIPDLPAPPDPATREVGTDLTDANEDGAVYTCTIRRYTMDENFHEIAAFDPNAEVLWPGALVQGATISGGVPALIPLKRAPATIAISPSTTQNAIEVQNPTQATVLAAVQQLSVENRLPASVARLSFVRKEAYSLEQGMLSLGLSANWLTGSARAQLSVSSQTQTRTVMVKFVQAYFTVSFTPPSAPAEVFDPSVTKAQVEKWMGDGNPPAYISSVTYGRMLIFKVSAKRTHDELKAALDMKYQGVGWSGSAELRQQLEKVLQESEIQVLAIGGSAGQAVRFITSGDLEEYLQGGAEFSPTSPGTPIAYAVKFLRNNRAAHVGFATSYSVPECQTKIRRIRVTFERLHVNEDCDALFDGSGDFFWTFRVNGATVSSRPRSNTLSISSGSSYTINTSHVVALPMVPDQELTIVGHLVEADGLSSGDDDDLGIFTHRYLFADNQWTLGAKSHHFVHSSGCHAMLYYLTQAVD